MAVRTLGWLAAALSVLTLSSGSLAARTTPSVPELLTLGADYVSQYAGRLNAVAADENYLQYDTSSGKVTSPRRLTTRVLWLGLGDNGVEAFRDVFSIDSQPVHAADDRLLGLFTTPTAASRDEARQLTKDGVRHYVGPNLHVLDDPSVALEFLRGANQSRSTFKLEGVRTVSGAQVAVLKFTEKDGHSLLSAPGNAPAIGRFWIDAASGTVRQTEIGLVSRAFKFHTTVKYAYDAATTLWLPAEMSLESQVSGLGSSVINYMGANSGYNVRLDLTGHATYTNYRQVMVDLSKLR